VDPQSRKDVVNVYKPHFALDKTVDASPAVLHEMYAALASDLMVDALDATEEELNRRREIITALMNRKSDSGFTPFQMHTEASQRRMKSRKRSGSGEKTPEDQRDDAVLLCLSFLQSAAVGRPISLKTQADGQVCYGPPSIKSIGSILRSSEFTPMDMEYYIAKDFYFATRRIVIPEVNEPDPSSTQSGMMSASRFASIPLFGENSLSGDNNSGESPGTSSPGTSGEIEMSSTGNKEVSPRLISVAASGEQKTDSKARSSQFARAVARRRSSMHFLEATIESLENSTLRSKTEDAFLASCSMRHQQTKITYTAAPLPAAILFDNFTAFKYLLSDGRARAMLEGSDSKGNSAVHIAAYRQTELSDSRYLEYLQEHVPESKNLIYRTNDASLRPGQIRVARNGGRSQSPLGTDTSGSKSNLIEAITPIDELGSTSTTSTLAGLRPFSTHFHVQSHVTSDEQDVNVADETDRNSHAPEGGGEQCQVEQRCADPIVITSPELSPGQRAFLALDNTPDEHL
jgi:hypothetical protein